MLRDSFLFMYIPLKDGFALWELVPVSSVIERLGFNPRTGVSFLLKRLGYTRCFYFLFVLGDLFGILFLGDLFGILFLGDLFGILFLGDLFGIFFLGDLFRLGGLFVRLRERI